MNAINAVQLCGWVLNDAKAVRTANGTTHALASVIWTQHTSSGKTFAHPFECKGVDEMAPLMLAQWKQYQGVFVIGRLTCPDGGTLRVLVESFELVTLRQEDAPKA